MADSTMLGGRSLAMVAADKVKQYIEEHNLQTGCKLPTELDLTRQFSVSRATVREAMRFLTAEGVVSVQQGRGTFVKNPKGSAKDILGIDILDEKERLDNLLEARLLLEPQIALSAVQKATEHDISRLERLVSQLEEKEVNDDEAMTLDIQFHAAIARCTHNPILERLVPFICESVQKTNRNLMNKELSLQRAKQEHRMILEAIRTKDAITARYTAEQHVQETIQEYKMADKKGSR